MRLQYVPPLIFIISSTNSGIKTTTAPNGDDEFDFANILMNDVCEHDKLRDFLAQPIEDVCDPLAW